MGSRVRAELDLLYRRWRSVDYGFDSRLTSRQLLGFLARKAVNLASGTARAHRLAFIAPSARIRSRGKLRLGYAVSIAEDVTIDATSVDGVVLGDSVTIDVGAVIRASGVLRNLGRGVSIGSRSSIGARVFLHGGGGIWIGEDCLVGPNVGVFSENHNIDDPSRPVREQGERRQSVRIGNDVWIGAGAIILAGVTVGDGAVVGAGAVVVHDVASRAVVVGVPAKEVGIRGRKNA